MKAGIITMHKVPNYGSHLQAYALQRAFEKMDVEAEIIDYKYPNEFHLSQQKEFEETVSLKKKIQRTIGFPYIIFIKIISLKQKFLFRKFERTYFKLSKAYNSPNELKTANLRYDLYVTGSDQVWNPRFAAGDSVFMCDFGNESVPRIAFGASVAVTKIPKSMLAMYTKGLKKYSAVGIREKSSKEMLEKLSGKKVEVVCDPVFLLDKEEWLKLAEKSRLRLPEKYILVYILTYSFDPYPEILKIIDEVKEKYGIPIIFINSSFKLALIVRPKKNLFVVSTEDFLNLFANATFIITTSFHGTAFSLIFNRQFISLVNDDFHKDSRIVDLLESVETSGACCDKGKISDFDITHIDYSLVRLKLDSYVGMSKKFLYDNVHCLGE